MFQSVNSTDSMTNLFGGEKRLVLRRQSADHQVLHDKMATEQARRQLPDVELALEVVRPGALRPFAQPGAEVDAEQRHECHGKDDRKSSKDTPNEAPGAMMESRARQFRRR
jgi:hypothetical protein